MTAVATLAMPQPMGDALADELVRASAMLGDLAYELGSDETTLRKHLTGLQSIDHVTQILLNLASVLRGGDGQDRLAEVTLEDMLARLRVHMH